MTSLLFNILFVAVGAMVGAFGGWCLRGSVPDDHVKDPVEPAEPELLDPLPEASIEDIESFMARLHQLTASVAADVDEHNTRVEEINQELVSGGDVVAIVKRLVTTNAQMQTQLQAAEKQLQTQANEIETHVKEARTDALTKLANRRAFDDEIRRCMEEFYAEEKPSCVMMIDVDHFKKFNDTYGHQAGDEVLKGVARVLRREFSAGEIVCRYGGEEFAILFPGAALDEVLPNAERGRAAIAKEVFRFQDTELKVTASGGVAQLQANETADQFIKRADDALYVCKENGRNCGFWHDGKSIVPMKDALAAKSNSKVVSESQPEPRPIPQHTCVRVGGNEIRLTRRERVLGLSDRDGFCRDLERRLAELHRTGSRASVLLIEVDMFSNISHEYGSKVAELALRAAAQIIKMAMREMDHAARFDTAVFALLLPGAGIEDVATVAERVRLAIENCKVPVHGEHLQFTVSLGAAEATPGDTQVTLLSRAMQALNAAKVSGGNQALGTNSSGEACTMTLAT